MATITQRIELQGGADAQKQLLDLAQAGKLAFSTIEDAAKKGGDLVRAFQTGQAQRQINDLVTSAKGLAGTFSQVSQGAQGASKDLQTVGTSTQGAARQVDSTNSKFSATAKTLLAIAAGAVGLGAAIFSAAKSAAEGAKAIGDAADESGTSLEAFQKGKFVLEQMNLSSKDAEKAISDLTDKVKENTATAVDALDKLGFRFANTEGGVKALKSAIGQLGTSNVVLAPLIQKLQQLGVAVAPGSDQAATIAKMAQSWGLAGSALQKVKDEDPDVVEILKQTADAIKGVGDEALQKQLAINAFGDDLGPKLVDKLKNGSEGIDEILADFKSLGLGASDAQVELGQNFANAMKRFSAATLQGRIEFGSNFLPIVTEGIKQFTNLLRLNRQPIQEWTSGVADSIKSLTADFFALFNGRTDLIKTGWLGAIVEGVTQAIAKIKTLFNTSGTFSSPFGNMKIDATLISEALVGVVLSFTLLKKAGDIAAPVLSKLFGAEIRGGPLLFATGILQATGVLGTLKTIAEIAGFSMLFLVDAIRAVVILSTAMTRSVIALGVGLILLAGNFKVFAAVLSPVAGALNNIFGVEFFNGAGLAETALISLTVLFGVRMVMAIRLMSQALFFLIARNPWLLAIAGAAALAAWITNLTGEGEKLDKDFADLGAKGKEIADAVSGTFTSTAASAQQASQETRKLGFDLDAVSRKSGFVREGNVWKNILPQRGEADQSLKEFGDQVASLADKSITLKDKFKDAFDATAQAAAAAAKSSPELAAAFDMISSKWGSIVAAAQALPQQIGGAFSSGAGTLEDAIVAPFDGALQRIQAIVDSIIRLTQSISAGNSGSFDITAGSGATFAAGGPVRGPGTTTSDSIFARLSRDEYVQPAKRVYQYGLDFMEALRRGLVPVRAVRALMGDLRGFSMGGLVDGLTASLSMGVPGFAGGGLVLPQPAMARAGGRPVVLVMPDGNRFNLTASDPVAEAVIRYARSRNVASAGRAPSRVRG